MATITFNIFGVEIQQHKSWRATATAVLVQGTLLRPCLVLSYYAQCVKHVFGVMFVL